MSARLWPILFAVSAWIVPIAGAGLAVYEASPPVDDEIWFGLTTELARRVRYVFIWAVLLGSLVAVFAQGRVQAGVKAERTQSRTQLSKRFASIFRSHQRAARSGWTRNEAHQFEVDLLDQLNYMLNPEDVDCARSCYYTYARDDWGDEETLSLHATSTGGDAARSEFNRKDPVGAHILACMKANKDDHGENLQSTNKRRAAPEVLEDARYELGNRPYASFVSKPIRDTALLGDDGLLGMLTVDFKAKAGPTDEQKTILNAYAQILTVALVGSESASVRVPRPARPEEVEW